MDKLYRSVSVSPIDFRPLENLAMPEPEVDLAKTISDLSKNSEAGMNGLKDYYWLE
jgi:hypothetical protein